MSDSPYPTTVSDHHVSVGVAAIKSVRTDHVRKEITVTLPLNGDNFLATNRMGYWAYMENPVSVVVQPLQMQFSELEKQPDHESELEING